MTFDILSRGHHEICELVDDQDDVGQLFLLSLSLFVAALRFLQALEDLFLAELVVLDDVLDLDVSEQGVA